METSKPNFAIQSRTLLLAAACLIGPIALIEHATAQELAELEHSRRSTAVQEAQELLLKGDESYQAGRYNEAIEAFAGARELIPDAPVSAELRAAATERYAQASVEQARLLSRNGDIAAAKALLGKVLRKNVAPNHPGAVALLAQLDDPIRTNPALTAEHTKDVDQVRRLLYTAEGAFDLGKFDEAKAHFEHILRIDPTNTAARRGMERVASAKSGYQRSAYDHTRAEMLSQVDASWEIPTAPELGVGPAEPGGLYGNLSDVNLATKLKTIIIPKIALNQATLREAIDFLRAVSITEDKMTADPDLRGVNFAIILGPPDSEDAERINNLRFDLQLSQLPLQEVLKYITKITKTSFKTNDYSVIISPLGSTTDEFITRDYRVPPDFLTSLNSNVGATEANDDPFAESSPNGGLITSRLTAQEALVKQGITFPEGASASYNPAANLLRVVNTPLTQDTIAQIVETIGQTEPVTVSVKVTMIKTQQSNLEELGFDWLMNPIDLNGELSLGGGTTGNTPGRTAGDFSAPFSLPADPSTTVNPGVVTNGLRSGDQAIRVSSLDELINSPNRSSQTSNVAPGILALTGLYSDSQAQMIMRGLDQKNGVDLMARPSILTRSGQSSSIIIARELIYPSEYEPPELPTSFNSNGGTVPSVPATPTAFETRELGISLEVLPIADANKRYIDITLNPSIVDFDGFVNYGSPIDSVVNGPLGPTRTTATENAILMPVFSVQKTTTHLMIADGATIVYAGLKSESTQNVQDSVPVLGDLPLVGRFFKSSSKQSVSTAIIFMVKVELLDPTGRPYRDK